MFLQRLEADADEIVDMPPPMYDKKRVKWVVDLAADGSLVGIVSTAGGDDGRDRGKLHLVPFVKRTSGVRPLLLADTPAYTLGTATVDTRAGDKHRAYMELLKKCAKETESQTVRAVLDFLDGANDLVLPEEASESDLVSFRVAGDWVVDAPEVQQFWHRAVEPTQGPSKPSTGQCVLCGQQKPIPAMAPVPVKGIPNGQSSGTALVGANIDVFESYGLKRGSTCGVCHSCGERFGKALNELLRDERSHLVVGPTVFVFWTSESSDFDLLRYFSKPTPEDVKQLLVSYRRGRSTGVEALEEARFHVAALSASGGRAVVRDFDNTTIDAAQRMLADWFALVAQVDEWGELGHPLGLYQLAGAPFRDASKQMLPHLPAILVRAALYGIRPLPLSLLALTVGRCKAGGVVTRGHKTVVTHAQAALMKAVLASSTPGREDYMSELDTTEKSVAYLCGRLFAVLESIQRRAIPGINATVVDKYFASASTAPASVFGKLLSDAQHHMSKLRKSSEGAYQALEARLEEVLAPIERFPATLSLRDQALFSLGFYHQRAADRAARKAAKATEVTTTEMEA